MEPNRKPAQLLDENIKEVMKNHKNWDSLERRAMLDAFYEHLLGTDAETRAAVIKGSTKTFLKKLMSEDDADNVEERVDLPENVRTAIKRLLDVIEQINQANKSGSAEEQEMALNVGLVALTDCMGDPDLAGIEIKGQKLPDFLLHVIGTAPDECNNILSSTVKPHLLDLYAGVPRVQQAMELLGFK